jgi:hypothetical protein
VKCVKTTSGIMKCCVSVETVDTDMNITYAPEIFSGNFDSLKYRKKGRKYGKK